MRRIGRIIVTWTINLINTLIFIVTAGRVTLHEGMVWFGNWVNWNTTFWSRPTSYLTPETEEEICRRVRDARQLRVVGGGHTFNASPLTDLTMISLDRYRKVSVVDAERRLVRVQAGIRLRDLTRELRKLGLDLPVLGSTDTQSIAGLVATDLHGTGKTHGFLSERIHSMRIVDSEGRARSFSRGDDAFHAAIGGLGACGVVIEVVIECDPAFNLAKGVDLVQRSWVEENLEELLRTNDHLSFYYLGGLDVGFVRMNTWNRTQRSPDSFLTLRKMFREVIDMLFSGFLLGLVRAFKLLSVVAWVGSLFVRAGMQYRRTTVYPSAMAFGRKLFFRHNENEYGVPHGRFLDCLNETLEHLKKRRFVTLIELRFTPDTSRALMGPGARRETAYIELAPSLSLDTIPIMHEVEEIFLRHGGQPHLGKETKLDARGLHGIYKESFETFSRVSEEQDPDGKFLNHFTRRLFR